MSEHSVVLLSGGLDSTTVLALAGAGGDSVHAVSFDYGQKHNAELDAACRIAAAAQVASHRVIRLDPGAFSGSALTDDDLEVPETATTGIPVTYVPARNTIFLSFALGIAEVLTAKRILLGVNAVDYSGYPDCRPEFVAAFQALADVATRAGVEGQGVRIEAPLIKLSKADIIRRGMALGVDYGLTVSCYQANDRGEACGRCDACRLRREGFLAAELPDPTRYFSTT